MGRILGVGPCPEYTLRPCRIHVGKPASIAICRIGQVWKDMPIGRRDGNCNWEGEVVDEAMDVARLYCPCCLFVYPLPRRLTHPQSSVLYSSCHPTLGAILAFDRYKGYLAETLTAYDCRVPSHSHFNPSSLGRLAHTRVITLHFLV